MTYVFRYLETALKNCLERGKSVLLVGPRQTGKTTLLSQIQVDLSISLLSMKDRLRYELDPVALEREVRGLKQEKKIPLVTVDEIQKSPQLLDTIQLLIDQKVAQFILTGSSARKLRAQRANMLPGRVLLLRLDPFLHDEYQSTLSDKLYFGDLPGIARLENESFKEDELSSYVLTYLDEEIRAEAVVRNVGTFHHFLQLAALESGNVINYAKLSQDLGVSANTVQSYFQILEDCLIAERVPSLSMSRSRRKLVKASKFLFFDMGVRRFAAREGIGKNRDVEARLFEQWVGLELIRLCRLKSRISSVFFWRDHNGPEVDWVLEVSGKYLPVEVKWTEMPNERDCKNIHAFMKEYPSFKQGYVVCRVPHKQRLSDQVTAIPWQLLDQEISGHF